MNNFESIYKELENLFINKLTDYIEKINVEHNDGIIIKPFENTKLEENCINLPSFSFDLEQAEYEEKDRIIENTIYEVSFEIKLPEYEKDKTIHLWRYIEAINKMLLEEKNEDIEYFRITKIQGAKVFIKLVI